MIKKNIRNKISVCVSTGLLAACAGGSFDTLAVETEPQKPPEPPKVEKAREPRQNPEEQAELKKPALGYVMKGLRRNHAWYDANGKELTGDNQAETHLELQPDTIESVNDLDLVIPKLAEMKADKDNRESVSHTTKKQEDKYNYIRFGHVVADNPKPIEETVNNKFVTIRDGWNSYTFYHGISAAAELPINNNVTYSGEWNFMSDVKQNKGKIKIVDYDGYETLRGIGLNRGADGDYASAIALADGNTKATYSSKFNVNFTNKTLTGELNYSSLSDEKRKLYDITAQLNGNRFTGSAKSLVTDASNNFDRALFYADSNLLEGGFYGPKAEEMAGKFLANDNSLFVVFGGKRDAAENTEIQALQDAAYISKAKSMELTEDEYEDSEVYDENTPKTRLTEVERKPLGNFGFSMKLRFGGKEFTLDQTELDTAFINQNPNASFNIDSNAKTQTIIVNTDTNGKATETVHICCDNLSYMRFGQLVLKEKANAQEPIHALYLQGERTPTDDMPQSGQLRYTGSWSGFIQTASPETNVYGRSDFAHTANMSNLGKSSLAGLSDFNVNFDNKSILGALYSGDSRKVFDINALINGTGFKGTANTDGSFPFDPENLSSGSVRANIPNATVEGGFYGPKARELGGTLIFNSEGDGSRQNAIRAGAVFGAEQQP